MTGSAPKVSVVCAWYNRADFLQGTIDSILGQDFDSFEMVIINDGSPDPRVREILDSYSDPRLTVIHHDNRGFTQTIRRAIAASRGEFIAVQGAGDISLPQRLRLQVAAIEQDPRFIGSGTARENISIGGRHDGMRRVFEIPYDVIRTKELMQRPASPINHGDLMFRRSVYDKVGGYRPFFHFAQDIDLLLRMSRHGDYKMCPEVLYQRFVFAEDGIASRVDRTLAQLNYAEMARGCMGEADRWGRDTVDIFGPAAGLFASRSGYIAGAKAKTALKYLRMGRFEDGAYLADVALREKTTPITIAVGTLFWLCRFGAFRTLLRRTLALMPMKDHREFNPLFPDR